MNEELSVSSQPTCAAYGREKGKRMGAVGSGQLTRANGAISILKENISPGRVATMLAWLVTLPGQVPGLLWYCASRT